MSIIKTNTTRRGFTFLKFLSICGVFTLRFQPGLTFQKINICNEYLHDAYLFKIPTYWSSTNEKITFSVEQNFISCPHGERIVTFNKPGAYSHVIEEEPTYPHFTPSGYIAVEMDDDLQRHYYSDKNYCVLNWNSTHLQAKICLPSCNGTRPCIKKCCPPGQSINVKGLTLTDNETEPCTSSGSIAWRPFLYDSPTKEISKSEDAEFNPHYIHHIVKCKNNTVLDQVLANDVESTNHDPLRLLKDGSLAIVVKERRWEKLNEDFCIDGLQNYDDDSKFYSGLESDQIVFFCRVEEPIQGATISWLYMVVMYIASIFLLITCIVYLLLWNTQNIHGWTVFCLVLSMYFLFIFLATSHLLGVINSSIISNNIRNHAGCVLNGILTHFFYLSTFAWLTVMNFDLWWTFKSLECMTERSLNMKRFFMYLPFGWGIPAIVVIIGITLDNVYPYRDSLVLTPEYGTVNCFIAPWALGVYVHYILAFLLALNFFLTVTTFFNLYHFKKGTSSIRKNNINERMKAILLVGKLCVVMGISWIFEVISWAVTKDDTDWWWIILDMYNLLQAFLIFLIFVCKPSTMLQLRQKYPLFKRISATMKSPILRKPSAEGLGNVSATTQLLK